MLYDFYLAKGEAMVDHYFLDEIPDELVKKYSLNNPGYITGWSGKRYPRARRKATPFTGYEILELNGKFYVRVPRTRTKESGVPKDGG